MIQIQNDCLCVTEKWFIVPYQDIAHQNPAGSHLFLSWQLAKTLMFAINCEILPY